MIKYYSMAIEKNDDSSMLIWDCIMKKLKIMKI